MSTITRYKRKPRTDTTRLLAVEPSASLGMPLPWDRGADLIRGGRLAMARGDGGDLRVLFHVGEPGAHPSDDWRDAFIDAGIAVCDRLFTTAYLEHALALCDRVCEWIARRFGR